MSVPVIKTSNLQFLKLVNKNNNRDWFNQNKERYLIERSNIENFASELLLEMNKHDVIETSSGKKSLYRIYRDIRFSNNKTPYNTFWSGGFKRATKLRRGGYYFHIAPGNSFVGGGFFGPSPEDLKRVRDEIAFDPKPIRKILKSKTIIKCFGSMQGEQIKTAPRGFESNNSAIDLLRYKQFLLIRRFSDKEVLSPLFLKVLNKTFMQMRPFLNYMSEVLTTDVNGIISY